MRRGKERRHVLADDTPPPLLHISTSAALPLLVYKIKVGTPLVLATDAVTLHTFL
jgi:hypothetical protein